MKELICIGCPKGCHLKVDEENGYKVTGNSCSIGAEYGYTELTNPQRVLTSTVETDRGRIPVKTNKPIAKKLLFEAMEEIRKTKVSAPVHSGDIIIADFMGSGADLIATKGVE